MKNLNVQDLSVTYNAKQKKIKAVDHVSFFVEAGDSLGIIGESGSGKSTMMNALLRLLSPKSSSVEGQVLFGSDDLLSCDEKRLKELRWKEIAVVFQKSMNSLSPIHTIGTQFEDVYRVHEPKAGKGEMHDLICGLFEKVNLNPRIYHMYPFELSGGMQQRLNIALSIMFCPSLLIMDEATTALDVVTQGQILEELMEMEKSTSITRLMITHDLSVVASSCKKILVLYAGRMMEFGTVEDILKNPKHPYTEGLIASFPSLYGEKTALKSIPGTLPDLSAACLGCIFAPRCSYATKECWEQRPKDYEIGGIHRAACHRCGGNGYGK